VEIGHYGKASAGKFALAFQFRTDG